MSNRTAAPLRGISTEERRIMGNLLRQSPEQQKTAPKPTSRQGEAQRRRRQKERETTDVAHVVP
jgi:hypothetical protein